MSDRTNPNFDGLIGKLSSIYGEGNAREILQHVGELLERYKGAADPFAYKPKLNETDIALITYADTINHAGQPPLEVLREFYLEHLQNIFEIVHILPFQPYSSDDGFAVIDYFGVRNDLGTWDDVTRLAGDCSVMADAVVNHMSSQAPWFRAFLDNDPDFADFFYEADPQADLSTVVRPRTTPLLTRFEDAEGKGRCVWTTFSDDQVDLNYRNPDVLVAVVDVLLFLVSQGIRLLRLDAVTFLWKEQGTSCANLPETHLLIKIIREVVSMLRDDVVVITETNVPHRENIAYFGDGHDEAHLVYNFALPPLLAHSFIEGNATHLREWAQRLRLPSDEVCFFNFSASHDGVGVRPVEEILDPAELQKLVDAALAARGLVSSRAIGDGEEHPYELNCTYLDLISKPDDTDDTLIERFIAAQAIVLAMPGVPAIYIQSLLGTRNDLARVQLTGRARSINRSHHDLDDVREKLQRQDSIEARIFNGLTEIVRLRRGRPEFDPYAPFDVLDFGAAVFAINRFLPDTSASVLCLVNVTAADVTIDLSDRHAGTDIVSETSIQTGRHVLPPYAVRWIVAPA